MSEGEEFATAQDTVGSSARAFRICHLAAWEAVAPAIKAELSDIAEHIIEPLWIGRFRRDGGHVGHSLERLTKSDMILSAPENNAVSFEESLLTRQRQALLSA